MPVVAALPPSPPGLGFGSYSENRVTHQPDIPGSNHIPHPTMQNGSVTSNESLSISEIKERAKEDALRSGKGISAISLLKSARSQSQLAQMYEDQGDLKGALSALLKAGSLAAMVMNSSEFALESKPGKHGVLWREVVNFQKHDGNNLKQRVESIESKLTDLEKSAATEPVSDTTSKRTVTSIADRVKSLNDAGLAVGTPKRYSREITPTPSSSTSRSPDPVQAHRRSTSIPSHPQPLQLPVSTSATASSSAGSSPHAVVPPSSLGPPSPVSSDSSSPRLSHINISEFTQAFPSIDELNELDPSRFPAVPTDIQGGVTTPQPPNSQGGLDPIIMAPRLKSFPSLSIDPGPRPSSTPITPTTNSFMSRPASPAITAKPSINNFASSALVSKPSPRSEKPTLPISNTVTPKQLFDYLYNRKLNTLLVDIRSREEFETEHIRASAILCLEPSVLMRASGSSGSIEDSQCIGPRDEWVLFQNREKFDLVVLYDASSETYDTNGPLTAFVRLVYENEFKKMLRKTPVLLIGGLQAWRKEFGEPWIIRGSSEQRRSSVGVVENQSGITHPPVNNVLPSNRISPEKRPPNLPHIPSVDHDTLFDGLASVNRRNSPPRPPSSTLSHSHSPSEAGDPPVTWQQYQWVDHLNLIDFIPYFYFAKLGSVVWDYFIFNFFTLHCRIHSTSSINQSFATAYKPSNHESTPEREAELEKLPQQVASEQEWEIYKTRNDSLVVDYFQGQFRNRMECLTCHHTSTTYNSFMYLSLPIASVKSPAKITLSSCLDAFVREEVMEKAEAWHCPKCKQLRKATKKLSLSRLPPVLLIHLKRFSVKGPFTDKIETVVDFPLKGLDLTNYMPTPLPPGMVNSVNGVAPSGADDPRIQVPPYKYDLYGVTNHFGSLSNGHYTAFIASRGGWLYCDDSRITTTYAREVVGRPAYVLYYKRVNN
ncbi:hypothetical protein ID866_2627 [Astraeus odoratus]|nr:hypothetical protein ID866_2627 [Astraeus odoratus]